MFPKSAFLLLFSTAAITIMTSTTSTSNSAEALPLPVSLEQEVVRLFDESDTLPIAMKRDRGNIEIRNKFDGDTMISLGEVKRVDYHPDDFLEFLENFTTEFPKINPMARKQESLERLESENREAVKLHVNMPFPLTNRIMIHYKYLKKNRGGDNTNEHMLLLSERENHDLLAKYHTAEEKKKYVLARNFLTCFWISPVCDAKGAVVGSNIKYTFSGDTGGSIPTSIQNMVGPKTTLDSVKGLVDYVKKQKESNSNSGRAAGRGWGRAAAA